MFIEDGVMFKSCVCVIHLEWWCVGFANASEIYMYVGSHLSSCVSI